MTDDDRARERHAMVRTQIEDRGVRDAAVLAAMRAVPRHAFVDAGSAGSAYADGPQAIGCGQTISQPYVVARMLEAARLRPGDRALEIGAGSGYAAAVAARIVAHVVGVERHGALAEPAAARLARLGIGNVVLHRADGTLGWPDAAPFDAIVVSAGGPDVPPPLKRQLAVGGRLVMPVGEVDGDQRLVRVVRRGDDDFDTELLDRVRFVPLIGVHGWSEGDPR